MKPLQIWLLFIVIAFSECKLYVNQKFHLERKFDFKDKASFLNYLCAKKLFDENHILYIDSDGYQNFINEKLQQDSSIVYQGCYINDSVYINRSSLLNENTSCMGRIDLEIAANFNRTIIPDSLLISGKRISSYHLKHLNDNTPFYMNPRKKINLLMVYAYSLGTYYDELYRKIMLLTKENETLADTYLICVDPVYLLK
jgi:hypothetical protein